jgi:hypothetical protein
MIAYVDAERSEQIKSSNRDGEPRPAKKIGKASEQSGQMIANDERQNALIDPMGTRRIEKAESPERPIDESGICSHRHQSLLRADKIRLSHYWFAGVRTLMVLVARYGEKLFRSVPFPFVGRSGS